MQFLNPRTDTGFKKLFGNEHHKNLTISFLNNVLDRKSGELIIEVTFRNGEKIPENLDQKQSFLDIFCTDEKGNNYIIEMQVAKEKNFLARMQYYGAFVLSQQLNTGVKYEKLVPVIIIAVVDHRLFEHHENVISHHFFTDAKTGQIALKHLQFHFVELPKFHKTVAQSTSNIDLWLYLMNEAENLEAIPQEMQASKELIEALHTLERAKWTTLELESYIADLDEIGREERIKSAAHEDGWKEGRDKGLKEGRDKGIKEGLEKGLEKGQLQAKQQIAIKALQQGLSFDSIAMFTGLSIEQIKELSKQ